MRSRRLIDFFTSTNLCTWHVLLGVTQGFTIPPSILKPPSGHQITWPVGSEYSITQPTGSSAARSPLGSASSATCSSPTAENSTTCRTRPAKPPLERAVLVSVFRARTGFRSIDSATGHDRCRHKRASKHEGGTGKGHHEMGRVQNSGWVRSCACRDGGLILFPLQK